DGTLLDYDLSIYTKAGQLVFHSQQLDNYWDGKISGNNEASEGVYFYVITATNDKNEKLTHKGTVQLIRR
ncbi:MAG: gliding motility-associated C-terminal domain-containing protein, partial [Bacteroidales bacterium]|nr:gliding motility-associated C-terminal domain-containing protein [Bacteroidales bacterium]